MIQDPKGLVQHTFRNCIGVLDIKEIRHRHYMFYLDLRALCYSSNGNNQQIIKSCLAMKSHSNRLHLGHDAREE